MARRPKTHEVWMQPKENGAALKRRRLREQFTQRELGLLSGCSHAFIGMLERGESTVGDAMAARIAKRLRCDVEDIFDERPIARMTKVPSAKRSTGRAA